MNNEQYDRVRTTLARIHYKGWSFLATDIGPLGYTVRVVFEAPDADTQRPEIQSGRSFLIPKDATVSEIVRTVFLAIKTAEEHEAREAFLFDAEPILSPHFDVEKLAVAFRQARAV